MVIVFDMDNTLTDEFGTSVRPGIIILLEKLINEDHTLVMWTNSAEQRARSIMFDHKLHRYFSQFIYREDYDPGNKGKPKDIRKVNGDVLIDDDPEEIRFVKSTGKRGFLISPYRKGKKPKKNEIKDLYSFIQKQPGFLKNK